MNITYWLYMFECNPSMHRTFKKLLPDAVGDIELVIAINVDVRGYTKFSESVDSVLALLYMRKIFEKLTSDFFQSASFFKSTGDGLLVVVPWDDKNLVEVVSSVISDSLRLVAEFPTLASDPAINFDVPNLVGVGLSRGSASLLRTKRTILDYSGRPLNVASRLMEVARPGGVVADSGFGIDLLPDDLRERFNDGEIYVHGLSEREPMKIFYSSDYTKIDPQFRRPIQEVEWGRVRERFTLSKFREHGPVFQWELPSKPLDPDEILVVIEVPGRSEGKIVRGTSHVISVPYRYELMAGRPMVVANHESAVDAALKYGTSPGSRTQFKIDYPVG